MLRDVYHGIYCKSTKTTAGNNAKHIKYKIRSSPRPCINIKNLNQKKIENTYFITRFWSGISVIGQYNILYLETSPSNQQPHIYVPGHLLRNTRWSVSRAEGRVRRVGTARRWAAPRAPPHAATAAAASCARHRLLSTFHCWTTFTYGIFYDWSKQEWCFFHTQTI